MKAKCYFCGGETDAIIFKEERRKHVWKDWLLIFLWIVIIFMILFLCVN